MKTLSLAFLASLGIADPAIGATNQSPPNAIFILSDDLGCRVLSAHPELVTEMDVTINLVRIESPTREFNPTSRNKK